MKEYPARQSHKINLKVQLRRLSSGRGEGIAIDTDIYIYVCISLVWIWVCIHCSLAHSATIYNSKGGGTYHHGFGSDFKSSLCMVKHLHLSTYLRLLRWQNFRQTFLYCPHLQFTTVNLYRVNSY